MTVAIYVRVSTGLQVSEGHSLDVQEEVCRAKATTLGFAAEQVEIFREEGYSGEDIDRPGLNRLLDRVKAGDMTHVIIKHPDRLSRSMTDKAILVRELQQASVKLVFVDVPDWDESDEAELLFNIIGSIAQYELRQIRRRTMGGKLKAVRQGQVMPMGAAPYGYRYEHGQLWVVEDEALFVRKVYRWYVRDGLTMREIGERLSEQGAIPRNGKTRHWGQTSILRILTSEIYVGRYYYNRRKRIKLKGQKTKSNRPKVRYEMRPRDEWLLVEVPAIVSEDLFRLAQQQRVQNRRKGGNVKRDYLLRGLIRCGQCGRKWTATSYQGRGKDYLNYRCPAVRRYGPGVERCLVPSIPSIELDDYVWNQIVLLFSDTHTYVESLSANVQHLRMELEHRIQVLGEQMTVQEGFKQNVLQMYEEGFLSREEVRKKVLSRQAKIDELSRAKKALQGQAAAHRWHDFDEDTVYKTAEDIAIWVKQENSLTFEQKRNIVALLFDEITITVSQGDPIQVLISSRGVFEELKQAPRGVSAEASCNLDSSSRYVSNVCNQS